MQCSIPSACRADVALINSGTFRSDAIHPPGRLTMKVGTELPAWQHKLWAREITQSRVNRCASA